MDKEAVSLTVEAITALEQGKKIEAIKYYREATGMGLKDSKDAVERYLNQNPKVYEQFKQNASSIGGKNWVILILILIALVVYLLLKGKF